MKPRAILVVGLVAGLAACGDGGEESPDANGVDAMAPDATAVPPCNTFYFNFEGVTLTLGMDSAPNDVSSSIDGTSTVPAYLAEDPGRDLVIGAMFEQIQTTLAPFNVIVVRERPAGDFSMIVIGGSASDVGLNSPGISGNATVSGNCSPVPNRVSFAFESVNDSMIDPVHVANIALGSILVGQGVPTSAAANDCMCWNDAACTGAVEPGTSAPAACTIGGASTPRSTNSPCGSGATFDEAAAIAAALTCP